METTFENAVVGDRVWSLLHGWGTVTEIKIYLVVEFKTNTSYVSCWFGFDGVKNGSLYGSQILFWDEISIITPERPKRRVKKLVERWGVMISDTFHCTFRTEEEAKEHYRTCPHVGAMDVYTVKLTGEYEVKE